MRQTLNKLTRRLFLGSAFSSAFVAGMAPRASLALTDAEASQLVTSLVGAINRVIASGKSESAMIRDFEQIFARYADVDIIARSTLGADSRRATPAQLRALAGAFQGYAARKYGKRFREFIGGEIEVKSARRVKTWHEVTTTVFLRGESPFKVVFRVSDRSGQEKIFDMIIEGVSMVIAERSEVGALLDANGGNIDGLIASLRRAG